jgi:hypothetical protein
LFESLESIDPLGELSFVIGGTAQSLVWIEQWAYARKSSTVPRCAARSPRD